MLLGETYCTDAEPGETVSVIGKFPDEIEEAQIVRLYVNLILQNGGGCIIHT